jgi:hypothetical protein
MAITPAQMSTDASQVVASLDLSAVPGSSTPLYVCYSGTGATGPFTASALALLTLSEQKAIAISPSIAVETCDLFNITVTGLFCANATAPTVAFSEDPTCANTSLVGRTSATVSQDGTELYAPSADLSSLTTATALYVCFSPNGASGPFTPSDSALLTMMEPILDSVTPSLVTKGCDIEELRIRGIMCSGASGYAALSTSTSCAQDMIAGTIVQLNVSADGTVCRYWVYRMACDFAVLFCHNVYD